MQLNVDLSLLYKAVETMKAEDIHFKIKEDNMVILTKPQRRAVFRKYIQNRDGAVNYREFRKRVEMPFYIDCIMLPWCGMWIGIESDGHAHS